MPQDNERNPGQKPGQDQQPGQQDRQGTQQGQNPQGGKGEQGNQGGQWRPGMANEEIEKKPGQPGGNQGQIERDKDTGQGSQVDKPAREEER